MTVTQEQWAKIIDTHKERFTENKGKRTPITIMGNKAALNMLVTGQEQGAYLTFDKCILRTSYGDIHFHEHRAIGDELMIL